MSENELNDCGIAERWFGNAFEQLHPQLQRLHRNGGKLEGQVTLSFGDGVAGLIGRRIAKKLSLPTASGNFPFSVTIAHDDSSQIWGRTFNGQTVTSVFTPVGEYPNGFWVEKTGFIHLTLGVKIIDGGWHWQQNETRIWRVQLPCWLQPTTRAYKIFNENSYEFCVSFEWGGLGEILCYKGQLNVAGSIKGNKKGAEAPYQNLR